MSPLVLSIQVFVPVAAVAWGLCPYLRSHRGATVALFACDREDGRCRRYCPRMETDWDGLHLALFDSSDLTPEIGAFKGLYVTRATDPKIRDKAQHGGTVSALACLALEQGPHRRLCRGRGGSAPAAPKYNGLQP